MTDKVISGAMYSGDKPPMVAITMDLACWDFVLSKIESDIDNEDETVRTIRNTCQKALIDWLPSVHRTVRLRIGGNDA